MQTEMNLEARAKFFYSALASGDRAALDTLLLPDFVGRTTDGLPFDLGGLYEGAATMRRDFWGRLGRFYDVVAHIESILTIDGARLVVTGTYVGSNRESKALFEARFVHLLAFVGGRLASLEQITDSGKWRDVAEFQQRTLEIEIVAGVARVRLNRPDNGNAINLRMAQELLQVALRCAADESIRAILLVGSGRSFTVGGDIGFMMDVPSEQLPSMLRNMTTHYHEAIRVLTRLRVPIVAAVHGAVAGGGLGLLCCADMVLAAEGCRFTLGHEALGLVMDGGTSWFLPRVIGARRAAELYFENRVLSASEAVDWGLINRVVATDRLDAEASALAERLAKGPKKAYAEACRLLRQTWDTTLGDQLAAETESLSIAAESPDVDVALETHRTKRALRAGLATRSQR